MRARAVIGLSALVGLGLLVYLLRDVMLPFVAGIALAYLLDPLADRLERLGLGRLAASLAILALFVIVLVVLFRPGLGLILVAIASVEWLDMARIVRGQALALSARDFVRAARALGLPSRAILARHIVPNALGPIAVAATLIVPRVILTESFLSFLGLGVQEPQTSWGVLVAEGARAIESAPAMLAAPAAFLVATLVALNTLGDRLADALDLQR